MGDPGLESIGDGPLIARLKSVGVSEVHLWLNGNEATLPCGSVFRYTDGATIWTAARVERFARELRAAGLRPVLTFSSRLRTVGYLDSLSAPDGPIDIARRLGDVDVELDVEGNGEGRTCPRDGLTIDQADRRLVAAVRGSTSGRLVVSSTLRWIARHPFLRASADVISPQLYGSHFGFTASETATNLVRFLRLKTTASIAPALSIECSEANARRGVCGDGLFRAQLEEISQASANAPGRIRPILIWGEREAFPCPHHPLCSVYASQVFAPATHPEEGSPGHASNGGRPEVAR